MKKSKNVLKKSLFSTHFHEKTKLRVRKKQSSFFPLIFFARAKNARFLTRAPTPPPTLLRKRPFLVTRKNMREKKLVCFLTNK
jgi:hypothetical protein